jgi:sugar O-acyltransferase (sialic acid O-acetyltransferase NeuD family)
LKAVLYGASGHGKVVYSILKDRDIEVIAFVDDNPKLSVFLELPVLKESMVTYESDPLGLISIGSNIIRKKISDLWRVNYFSVHHPTSYLHATVRLGEGSIVMQNATIQYGSNIGKHCIINTASVVDHECEIEDFAHIAPGSILCGGVGIGEGTLIGAGSTILPSVRIGNWCTIGAGSVVLKDVPNGAVMVGNPAKRIN